MADAEDDIPSVFYDRLQKRILKYVGDKNWHGMGCWQWIGRKKSGGSYGIVHLRVGGDRMCVHAHRASYIACHRKFILPGEISHCCHHGGCVNPQHLEHEKHDINMDREKCRRARKCGGHTSSCGNVLKDCLFNLTEE